MIHQKKRKKRKQLGVRKGVISIFYSYVPWRQGKLGHYRIMQTRGKRAIIEP